MDKKVVYSGIQPSGQLTIGNYLGALNNFSKFVEEYMCYYCIVDMHAITNEQIPAELRKRTLDLLSLYIACGLDPEKCVLYIQSHVPEQAELMWVLNTISYMGHLGRMTQYKDKAKSHGDNIPCGLFNYPILMAADILLYDTDLVPVGDDQKQHLEYTRDLAIRFNHKYSETFKVPELFRPKQGARVMSLQDPGSKMSKSDKNGTSSIYILDEPELIRSKIRKAVTDSLASFNYTEEQPGLRNLIDIYAAFSGAGIDEIVEMYKGKGYGVFKEELAELIISKLDPVQAEFKRIRSDKAYLESVYSEGAVKARSKACKTLSKVYRKIGFVPAIRR